MKVKYKIDFGTKKAGQVIDVNAYYVADLIKQGIVSPLNGGTKPPVLPEPPKEVEPPKEKKRGKKK